MKKEQIKQLVEAYEKYITERKEEDKRELIRLIEALKP